jgi:hypothetical protein
LLTFTKEICKDDGVTDGEGVGVDRGGVFVGIDVGSGVKVDWSGITTSVGWTVGVAVGFEVDIGWVCGLVSVGSITEMVVASTGVVSVRVGAMSASLTPILRTDSPPAIIDKIRPITIAEGRIIQTQLSRPFAG